MRKKYLIGAMLAIMLLVGVTTAYAISWYNIRAWANQYVPINYQTCRTFPNSYAVYQRMNLKALSGDPDLRVWGYSSSLGWRYIGGSYNAGLQSEIIRVPRYTYTHFQVCVLGYLSSYYTLRYQGGI